MPQPTFLAPGTSPAVARFGGLALPNGQGTMANVDLNDGKSWFLQGVEPNNGNHVLSTAPQVWLGQGSWLSEDWGPKTITLTEWYYEGTDLGGSGAPISSQKALLGQCGEQYLTFDNLTAIKAKMASFGTPKITRAFPPWWWQTALTFLAVTPWAVDLSATTPAGSPWALAGNTSGATTAFSIAYAGSVYARPVFTLTIPNTNTAPIQQFRLANTMSGETLTVLFPGFLAASIAWTLTIDCGAMTVADQGGKQYDPSGSFPALYGPAGQSNAWSATLTTASGTSSGVTLGASYSNRWEI